ncbi:ATP-NAD kinase-like domain-containing protein [Lasiosphaeris hirsuta]|uniref:ATP-NAD kinase-like domain-containing protein n=1 Tax=Lasiosphaeris hirsuta TaxID=260670 RepID=A0AA40DZY1_9PEZI|nr:ATP-NAD kinase-like domain-containing protein [Lasiosphaeris hirsuta]
MASIESSQPLAEDGQSSASDEDRNAFEVVFDPASPYRRKSSLVASDPVPVHLRRGGQIRTECLVHQFLESQKRGRQQGVSEGGHQGHQRQHHDAPRPLSQVKDISHEASLNRIHDLKGATPTASPDASKPAAKVKRCALLDGSGSDTSTAGQIDEKEWKTEMINKTPSPPSSELELKQPVSSSHTETDTGHHDYDCHDHSDHYDRRHEQPDTSAIHSRLLTKKQLSEMAWGVRELSRRLGSIRLRFRVKTIFLLAKVNDAELLPKARALTRWLLDVERDVRYVVYVEQGLRDSRVFDAEGLLGEVWDGFVKAGEGSEDGRGEVGRRLRVWDEAMCRARPHTFDFVITLGGDGTVLYASWLFQRIVPPVLSFALGSLGFLTKFDFEDYERTLTRAFNEGVSVGLRLRFEGTIMRSRGKRKIKRISQGGEQDGEVHDDEDEEELQRRHDLVDELIGEEKDDERTHRPDGTHEVLNEIVVDRGPNPTMSEIEIFGDDEHFTTVMADGVCVSTPTGSTAYNLAAGGSLCHPENPVMLLTAISPHTLSFRPIILPDTIVLRLGVPYNARTSSWAGFDGRERVELRPGDYVTISASRYPFASVQFHGKRNEDWINSISKKLSWNTRSKPKAFKEWEK